MTFKQQASSFPHGIWTGIARAEHISTQRKDGGEPAGADDLDAVADRLEAALDRIVRQLATPGPVRGTPELAARLDGLIERLRDALGPPRDRDSGG